MSTQRAVVVSNLFKDPAIFHLPQPLRDWLAASMAKRLAPVAIEIYRRLGGGSLLLGGFDCIGV